MRRVPGGELTTPIANQESELPDVLAEVHDELAGLLDPSGWPVAPKTFR
jgi:hypothetical protein